MKILLIPAALLLLGAAPPTLKVDLDQQRKVDAPILAPDAPALCPEDSVAQGVTEQDGQFHRLADLPPGETYMAVYRLDEDGCADPLTAIEYRAR
ncbi:hypothetical protein [Sphingomicrobium arenosum]|uniref:hypothetical protein n=1 Tax=Sphingomicrobium arenosum TaxID=2233861 RepID=UPI002240ED0C|nr:hypothetical protein [Sphingomicrobium arenosum]